MEKSSARSAATGIIWYDLPDYQLLQGREFLRRLTTLMLLGLIVTLVVGIVSELGTAIIFFMGFGVGCGAISCLIVESKMMKSAPMRIGLSSEGIHYIVRSAESQIAFADIKRMLQRKEANYGVQLVMHDKRIVSLSCGVGLGSDAGGALREAFETWCVRKHGNRPLIVKPRLMGRWSIVLVAPT